MNIQHKQRQVLERMLALNDTEGDASSTWKVLVYDTFCQNVLSPILDVGALRNAGVTLHLHISSLRQPVHDAPAIYFVEPTEENISIIAEDCSKGLYNKFYLNFSSQLDPRLMESLALQTLKSDSSNRICKVFDQFVAFTSQESSLFSLEIPQSFVRLNSLDDKIIMDIIDRIVDGLFSVCVSLGQVPIIRARPGEAAEMVGRKLDEKLRNHLKEKHHLFSGQMNFQRPILVLLDRSLDIAVPLHHPWTYQALLHDLMDLRSNRVAVGGKYHNLDQNDEFWIKNKGAPFPKVAENVDRELKEYQAALDQIQQSKASGDSDIAGELEAAIQQVPELLQKKQRVQAHTNIASELMKILETRALDSFFAFEERMIVNRFSGDKSKLKEFLRASEKGTAEDKLRLLLIYILTSKISSEELKTLEDIVAASGCDVSPVEFVKKLRMMHSISTSSSSLIDPQSASSGLFGNLADRALGKGMDWIAGNVKNLLPAPSDLLVTQVTKFLLENAALASNAADQAEKYLYLDPRVSEDRKKNPPRAKMPFKQAIVFIIGGGNFVESQNLQDFASRTSATSSREVIYGSTELLSPKDFLLQLSILGSQGESSIDLK